MYHKFWIKFWVNRPLPHQKTNANGGWFPFTSISWLLGIGSLVSAVGGEILDFLYTFLYHTNKTKARNLNNKAKQKKYDNTCTNKLNVSTSHLINMSENRRALAEEEGAGRCRGWKCASRTAIGRKQHRKPDGNVTLLFDLRTNVRKVTWAVCGVRRSLL